MRRASTAAFLATAFLSAAAAFGQAPAGAPDAAQAAAPPPVAARVADRFELVEEFTAATLTAGEVQLGTELAVGVTDQLMVGTDLVSALVGAATIDAKYSAFHLDNQQFSLGLRAAYLNKNTLFAWGSLKSHYDTLDAHVLRPSLAWTNVMSPRLKLHTFYAKGFGSIHAQLSAAGKRDLWEQKHPGEDYDQRDPVTQAPTTAGANAQNQARPNRDSPTSETIDVQSLAGLAQDRFQLTSESIRANGNKILVTVRIEQTNLEELKSSFFRLTAAHQWVWQSFQIRLGVGVQYLVMTGTDLDDEHIDQAGWQPASDIAFYWRF